ncbi:LuxR C-terminal-related transcriptional regulator [Microbispora sp. NPDC046973]|uniref:helix-turn-helix transcriptional regulator n=1 Tax=Microbispora sp. NPDC046973 TaxID=3155022 RepID=UPI0033EED665
MADMPDPDLADDGAPPPELTSFVGRRAELHMIGAALGEARLVTLTGAGGCGKTRLAARLARRPVRPPRDGVWWVDLAQETDPAAVPRLVATVLRLLLAGDSDGTAALSRQLRERELLLVLDNCEHLLGGVAAVVAGLLRHCPHVTVLATSREPLGLPGELVWRVPPLDAHAGVALFLDRGRDVPRTEEALAVVRRICARLDGIPLALELAAAWTGTLTPEEIDAELDDRFSILVTGHQGTAPRHRTLAASMAWSHDLLQERDQVLFRRLGVFEPGFTLAAAEGALDGHGRVELLTGLRRLIDKSLLLAETRKGVTRYRMLSSVKQYAWERLAEAGELAAARDRHLAVCLALVREAAPLLDSDKDAWRARMREEYPNLRTALEWGLGGDRPDEARRLAAELAWLWHLEGRLGEGLGLLRLAAERGASEHSALQARVLTGLALVADTTHPAGLEFDAADTARAMALDHGDPRTACLAGSLSAIGMLLTSPDEARVRAATVREEAVAAGDAFVADAAQVLIGLVHHMREEHRQALAELETPVRGLLRRGDRGVAALALGLMALGSACLGELPRARTWAEQAVEVATPLADYHRAGTARAVLARVCLLQGDDKAAELALDPVIRLVDQAPSAPFVPRLALTIGQLCLSRREPVRAAEWFRSETAWRGGEQQDELLTPETRIALAAALRQAGDPEGAARACAAGLDAARALGMPRLIAEALEQQAFLDEARAVALHLEALRLRAANGLRLACVDSLEALAALADATTGARIMGACDRAREELGYPRPHRPSVPAAPEGRRMELEEAVAFTLRAHGGRRRPATGWASLTPAEQEVVRLAAAGLSNPEIAGRLFMSRSTVKTHLAHVYAKLGVANRTELAALHREHDR